MNVALPNLVPSRRKAWLAFTLPETLITMAVMSLVLTGVLYSNVVGAKMYQITRSKLGASDQARSAISLLISEVRSAKTIKIGGGSLASFTEVASGSAQNGTAIQLCMSTNTNTFIRYYLDANDKKLKRTTNGATYIDIVAEFITNNVVFTSENFAGTVLTDNQNNRVIGLTLQFYQIQYPITLIGAGNFYDFYQLRTKITRRVLE